MYTYIINIQLAKIVSLAMRRVSYLAMRINICLGIDIGFCKVYKAPNKACLNVARDFYVNGFSSIVD